MIKNLELDSTTIIREMQTQIRKLRVKRFYNNFTQASIRCPYCNDSIKLSSSHLYILLTNDPYLGLPLFPFDCKKCDCDGNYRGSIFESEQILEILDIVDNDVLYEYYQKVQKENLIKKANSARKTLSVQHATHIFRNKRLFMPVKNNALNRRKLAYVNNRLPFIQTLEDMSRLNMVPSIGDVYTYNKNLPKEFNVYKKKVMNRLHKDYVGFVSVDYGKITFRDITNTHEKRYYNLGLYENDDNSQNLYFIPTTVNIMSPYITVVIAEGAFDVVRAYYDFYNCREHNVIYAAAGNSHGYAAIIKHILSLGFVNFNVDLYADQDVTIDEFAHVRLLCPTSTEFRVNYNLLSKDIGNMYDPCHIRFSYLNEIKARKMMNEKMKRNNSKRNNRRII